MIGKNIDQIAEEDLQSLVDEKVVERKTLDYKQTLPGNSDEEKVKFLADVSSFANASGGDLVYGIVEDRDTGLPEKLEGFAAENIDQEILRLRNMARDGIKPRVPYFESRPVRLSNSRWALVIRVQKSWRSPHRVTFKGHDKFYSRSTNGRYQMDVDELRTAFTLSETIVERIRSFREDRISKIVANETPITITGCARIVLHLIPIASFNLIQGCDVTQVFNDPGKMPPMWCGGWNHRYNLDGVVTYSPGDSRGSGSYVQLFRTGIVEAVEGRLLEPSKGDRLIPSVAYEKVLIDSLGKYLSVLEGLGVPLPIFAFLALLNVKGYRTSVDRSYASMFDACDVDRDMLLLPEVLIERYDVDGECVLKPCFDAIWNACGYPGSPRYDKSGKYGTC